MAVLLLDDPLPGASTAPSSGATAGACAIGTSQRDAAFGDYRERDKPS